MIERPYWWDTVSDRPPARIETTVDASTDVAIVGSGYTGLSAARALAHAGARVDVFERDDLAGGASTRNAGQVLTGLRLDATALLSRYGAARARALFEASQLAMRRLEQVITEEGIECEFVRCGHVQAAVKANHFEGFRREQAALATTFDHRVELVGRDAQQSEIGSDIYHGLLVDEASAGLNPAQYAAGLASAAARAGARLHARTPVDALSRLPAGWRVSTSRGPIDAAHVLIATNGYATRLTPSLQRRFLPVGSYIVVTAPLDPATASALLPRGRMAFDSRHFLHYYRLTSDRRLLFGGRAEFGVPGGGRTRRAAEILRRALVDVFPVLSQTAIDYAWGGNVAFTRDQLPHAGRLDDLWFAGGYGGHGIAMATLLGELIAARIGGAPAGSVLLDLPCPTIPLLRDRPWCLPLLGAWYRVRDWLE